MPLQSFWKPRIVSTYWDALKAQREELGYAEDENEIEVTDDEEEEMVEN
jgi:hypothetical protein